MPFLFPINALMGEAFTNGVEFAGATQFEIAGTVTKTAGATFAGKTELSFFAGQGAATFAGETLLVIAGRLNDDPNVLADVEFAGATEIEFEPTGQASAGVLFAGETSLALTAHLERAQDLTFTFLVDIADSDLSAALSNAANIRKFTARLVIDGEEVPILRATINAPDGALGTELSIIFARPDVSQVSASSTINFDIGVWAGGAWAWIPILTGGRMSGRGAHYANQEGLPADAVEVSFVDIMGDRWNRRPAAQTILYDPQIVDPPSVDTIRSQTIYNATGGAIEPFYSAIFSMRLRDVFKAAYVEGCGFSSVVSNIDNFAVEQVAFSFTGGYDAGVRPLISAFDPIVFVVGNDLWIVTQDNPLPAGFNARDFAASNIESIDDQLPQSEPINALLVHLKDDGTGEYFTERLEAPPVVTSGIFGTSGYTETQTERRVREYRDFDNPTVIKREDEIYLKTTVEDYQFNVISRDTRTNSFDALNRPTGYTLTQESLLPDLNNPDKTLTLQTAHTEKQIITYAPHPLFPSRDLQSQIITEISGQIVTDNDRQYLGKPYKISLHNAHKSGYVDADADASSQVGTFGALKTITETLRVNGGQVVRDRRVTDHVANVVDPPVTQVLPGDASFDRRRETGKTRTVLLTIAGSDASGRRVAEFDATSLPSDIGMKLAAKRLARLNSPPRELNANLPFIDVTMRRGLDLNVHGRTGSLGTFIVRGYTISVGRNSEGVVEGKMTLTGRELT
jgi:hypothetical protein